MLMGMGTGKMGCWRRMTSDIDYIERNNSYA